MDRDRDLLIWGTPGRLTILAPPGEVAYVHPRNYEKLRQALQDSLVDVYRAPERRSVPDGPVAEPQNTPQRGSAAGAEVEHGQTAVTRRSLGPQPNARRAEP